MLKSKWNALKPGDLVGFEQNVFVLASRPDNPENIQIYQYNGNIYDGFDASRVLVSTLSITQTSYQKFKQINNDIYKEKQFGYVICNSRYGVMVAKTSNKNDKTMQVMDNNGIIHEIPRILFIPHHHSIESFISKYKLLYNNSGFNDAVLKYGHKKPPLQSQNNNKKKAVKVIDYTQFSANREFVAILLEFNVNYDDEFFTRHTEGAIECFICKDGLKNEYYVLPTELSIITSAPCDIKSGSKVKYIGKEFSVLKNGDICVVLGIKADYASSKFNVVQIKNLSNNYVTRVFAKNVKKIVK